MNDWIPKTRGPLLTGLCALAILASNAFGGLKAQRAILDPVDGIDAKGNADPLFGFDGPGKSYKNIKRGIIVQINRSLVSNLYLKPKHFRDRGLPILDPQTGETLTTTRDLLIVEQKQFQRSGIKLLWYGTQIKVYDPRYPVLTPQTPTVP